MQFSTKARYAARAMLELAMNYENGPMQLKEISRKQEISEKYLEQIMLPLRTNGFVYTQKGSRGGYYLNRPPEQITLFEIVQTVEGSLAPVACVDNPKTCSRNEKCAIRSVWAKLGDVVSGELKSVTMAELAEQQKTKYQKINSTLTYHI